MATITSNGSGGGNWSAGATWQGGVAPADGDTVVIAAGDTVTFDADLSAWTTGVAGLTITSAAAAPGKLECSTSSGTYVLPIKAGTKIQGTNNTVRGRLYAGSFVTPLPNAAKFTIKLLGTTSGGAQIDRTYLDVKLYCTQPTYRWVKLSTDEAAGQTVLSVDTDVTGDIWADGDVLAICNVNKACDYQRTTIAAGGIAASTITVAGALDSLNVAGAYLVRVTRNVEITSEGSQVAVLGPSGGLGSGALNCAIRQIGVQQGYGLVYGGYDTVDGVINGFTAGISGVYNVVASGCLVGNRGGMTSAYGFNYNCIVSGLVAGSVDYGTGGLLGGLISGTVAGCGYGIYTCTSSQLSGEVYGCYRGLYTSAGMEVSGSITNCSIGIFSGSTVLQQGAVIGGSGASANTEDVRFGHGVLRGYGAGLRSTTQVADYLQQAAYPVGSAILYDVADASGNPQPGRMKWWTCYGYGASEDFDLEVHETPPVPLEYVHKQTMMSSSEPARVDVPIWGEKDVPLIVRVYIRKAYGCLTEPYGAALIDPSYAFGDPAAELVKVLGWEDTDWQTLTLSYTPTHDRQLILRVFGEDDDNGWLYWNFDVRAMARRPRLHLMGA